MRVNCEVLSKKTLKTDLLCLPVFEDKHNEDHLDALDRLLLGQVKQLLKDKHFSGKAGEQHLLVIFPKREFRFLLLLGMGKSKDIDIEKLRKAAGTAGQKAVGNKVTSVAFLMPNLLMPKELNPVAIGQAVMEGFNLGSYFFDKYKSGSDKSIKPNLLTLLFHGQKDASNAAVGARTGLIVSDLQNYCRDLAGSPGNVVTPSYLVNEARRLSRRYNLKVQIMGRPQIEKLKMGAFLAVAEGSAQPPYLIRIDYKPKAKSRKHAILVGKGITFDTGGITLKPGADMHEMKQDMAGAAVVLSTMAAVAQLKPKIAITGFIPTCENMPGSRAYRPGDVLTTCNGKTIEVISTDAEGRLLLADVLAYAAKMKPDYLIDIATLTGAVIVALGYVGAAMLSTSNILLTQFKKASESTGEKLWQMPLWPEYEHAIKSPIADMKNSGGRPAGTCVAATILKHFVNEVPWLHLDIAGMDLEHRGTEYTPKGASGYGVRLLTEVLRNL
jgi:leucyl aminopeptidase